MIITCSNPVCTISDWNFEFLQSKILGEFLNYSSNLYIERYICIYTFTRGFEFDKSKCTCNLRILILVFTNYFFLYLTPLLLFLRSLLHKIYQVSFMRNERIIKLSETIFHARLRIVATYKGCTFETALALSLEHRRNVNTANGRETNQIL